MYHIKENGKFLCGKKPTKFDIFISYSCTQRASLIQCCPICKQKYIELITKLIKLEESKEDG